MVNTIASNSGENMLGYLSADIMWRLHIKTYSFLLRYLIPSHSLICPQVATVCKVKGCNKTIRRGEQQEHIRDDQMRHFALLREEKDKILWEAGKKVRLIST